MNQKRFVFENGKWTKFNIKTEEYEPWQVYKVPINEIVNIWEELICELSSKEVELSKVKSEFAEKEFQIKYVEDIDFKTLYGKANDDTRNHHVKSVCSDLFEKKQNLELSIDYLKREISLLKTVVNIQNRRGRPHIPVPEPRITFDGRVCDAVTGLDYVGLKK